MDLNSLIQRGTSDGLKVSMYGKQKFMRVHAALKNQTNQNKTIGLKSLVEDDHVIIFNLQPSCYRVLQTVKLGLMAGIIVFVSSRRSQWYPRAKFIFVVA